MKRSIIVLQWLTGWLPVAALFTLMIVYAHGQDVATSLPIALRLMLTAAVLGFGVTAFVARCPWPHPFRFAFAAQHALAAMAYATAWLLLNALVASIAHGRIVLAVGPGVVPFLILGGWLYVMIAGIAYAHRAAARAATLEAAAARAQLAALQAQIQPHFLFNALHAVAQLIPEAPSRAVRAVEQLGEALLIVIDERRDRIALRDELAFVRRYLALEALRFGDRLVVVERVDEAARDATVPSFALQTLVENAVQHGVAPSVATTTLTIAARVDDAMLVIEVSDDGAGFVAATPPGNAAGTGLPRLRERIAALYGNAASLVVVADAPRGCRATLRVPAEDIDDVA